MSVPYRLIYFNLRCRGEPIRLMLNYAGVPFEDVRLRRRDWPETKSKTPHGHVPYLEIGDRRLSELNAIMRFIARQHDLEGRDPLEIAEVDSLNEVVVDVNNHCIPYWAVLARIRKKTAAETIELEERLGDAVANNLPIIENALFKSMSGYLAPSGITWADFTLASLVETLGRVTPDYVTPFAAINAHSERIFALSQLQKYLSSRPDTF